MADKRFFLQASLVFIAFLLAATSAGPVVTTIYGQVEGVQTTISQEYLGLPYAAPPVGLLRFRPPVAPNSWSGVRDATSWSAACPQTGSTPVAQSEDCLYLNVYTPADATSSDKRDVMFFIHGGSFTGGTANTPSFNASRLASTTGVIVVVTNYRLGILGLIGHIDMIADSGTFGNYCLMDLVMALTWVKDNIAAFGGNPNSVTIFGQSAGAAGVGILLTVPAAKGLFHRAIMESGAPIVLADASLYSQISSYMITGLGCPFAGDFLGCFRNLSVASILSFQSKVPFMIDLPARPAVDGIYLPDQPLALLRRGEFHNVPIIAGFQTNDSNYNDYTFFPGYSTTQEQYDDWMLNRYGAAGAAEIAKLYNPSTFPVLYNALAKVDTDRNVICATRRYLRALLEGGGTNVRMFRGARNPSFANPLLGAFHTIDLAYVFGCACSGAPGTPSCGGIDSDLPSWTPGTGDAALSNVYQTAWSSFAKTSDPGYNWPKYSAPSYNNIVLDAGDVSASLYTDSQYEENTCDWWDTQARYCGDGLCSSSVKEDPTNCPVDCALDTGSAFTLAPTSTLHALLCILFAMLVLFFSA